MEQYVYNDETGLWYKKHDDIYLPCIRAVEDHAPAIGRWGRKHLTYIREYKRVFYTNLLTTGKLNRYLAEVDSRANRMYEVLMELLPEREDITERLKEDNPMEWVRRMNNLKNRAEEIVNTEVIFV